MVQHMSDAASILSSTPTLIQPSDERRFVELHSVSEPRRHDGFMRLQESENAPSKRLREWMFGPTLRPWFTWTSATAMVIIMIFEYAKSLDLTRSMIQDDPFNPLIGPSSTVLIITGARYTPCLRPVPSCVGAACTESCHSTQDGYRFLSALFIHAGLIHIGVALVIHVWIGAGLERSLGVVRFAMLYLVPGTFGFVLSSLVSPANAVSTGCTGALMGLVGFMLVDMAFHPDTVQKKRLAYVLLSIPMAFLFGLFPYIDNFCHLGGLAMGIVMGCAVVPQRITSSCIAWSIRAVATCMVVAVFASCLYAFYSMSDPTTICPNCKYFSCVPISNWCEL